MDFPMIDVEIGRTPSGYREFPVEFKIQFIALWHQCLRRGDKTRLLRQYSLDSQTVHGWLRAERRGDFTASMVAAAEKSPKRSANQDRATIAQQNVRIAQLEKQLAQTEGVVDILGKAYELLEEISLSSEPDLEPKIPPALMGPEEYANWLARHRLS